MGGHHKAEVGEFPEPTSNSSVRFLASFGGESGEISAEPSTNFSVCPEAGL